MISHDMAKEMLSDKESRTIAIHFGSTTDQTGSHPLQLTLQEDGEEEDGEEEQVKHQPAIHGCCAILIDK